MNKSKKHKYTVIVYWIEPKKKRQKTQVQKIEEQNAKQIKQRQKLH